MTTDARENWGPGHAHLAESDAAYVLGALSAPEREAFEEHLAVCPACRHAVHELEPMPGLLTLLSPEQGAALVAADDVTTGVGGGETGGETGEVGSEPGTTSGTSSTSRDLRLERLLREAHRRGRRRLTRRVTAAAFGLAAAIALVVAIGIPTRQVPDAVLAMDATAPVPLEADVGMTEVAWGTRLDVDCVYPQDAPGDAGPWQYALVVVAEDGEVNQVSTWEGHRGTDASFSAATATPLSQIERVEVRNLSSGKVLLTASPTGAPAEAST